MQALHILVRICGYILVTVSVLVTGIFCFFPTALGFRSQVLSNLFGVCGVSVAIAVVSIWVLRKIYIEIKKRKIPDFEITKTTLMFLRKHHILLGWATILSATAHGIYYILLYPNRADRIVTGLLAWGTLAILVVFGAWLDYRIKTKVKSKRTRVYHIALATLFLITLFIHA